MQRASRHLLIIRKLASILLFVSDVVVWREVRKASPSFCLQKLHSSGLIIAVASNDDLDIGDRMLLEKTDLSRAKSRLKWKFCTV